MDGNERSKARYWRMVHEHRCPACGYDLPKGYYYVYCEYCRKRKSQYKALPRIFTERLNRG